MGKVRVRHGAVTYSVKVGGRDVQESAFRGMVIDVSAEEEQRLRSFNAVVDVGTELTLPGRLTPLPNTASDEELIAWASVANKGEVAAAIAARPEIGDRLRAARQVVSEKLKAQNELLGGLDDVIEDGQKQAKQNLKAASKRDKAQRGGVKTPTKQAQASARVTADDDDEEDDLDDVVKQDGDTVAKFVADNPQHAAAVMEAENRLAQEHNREPRDVIIQAVTVAAAHAGQ